MNARFAFAFLGLMTFAMAARADDGPAANVPGLAELAHYVGEWDIRITSPNSGFTAGHVSSKWILGGRFVEQQGMLTNPNGESIEVRTLLTYNVDERKYQSWTFLSTGSAMARTGEWDPDTQTFSYTSHDSSTTIVTSADFSEEGTETWEISTISDIGAEVVVISGVNTRRE